MPSPSQSCAVASQYTARNEVKYPDHLCIHCCKLVAERDFSCSPLGNFLYVAEVSIHITREAIQSQLTNFHSQPNGSRKHQHVEGELCAQCITAKQRPALFVIESLSEHIYVAGQIVSVIVSFLGAIVFGIVFLAQFLFPGSRSPQSAEEYIVEKVRKREEEYHHKREQERAYAEHLDHLAHEKRLDQWADQALKVREFDRWHEYKEDADLHEEQAEEKRKESQRKKPEDD